jgi:streptogramin lyase
MAISGDGKLWFNEFSMNQMGRLDAATGKIDEFDIPLKGCGNRKMGADSEGNLWVGCYSAGKLLKIDQKTAAMTTYSPPTENSGVYGVAGDPKSKLVWFSEQRADKIARFDPQTQTYVEYPMISAESDVRRMEVDPNHPNRIWWSGHTSNLMGYIEILSGDTKRKQ